jgi:hypothetical protein
VAAVRSNQLQQNEQLSDVDAIATRRYVIRGSDPSAMVTVRLGVPMRRADGLYECAVELTDPSGTMLRFPCGVDAMEALQLALILIGTDLKHINEQVDGALFWVEGNREDLGVPTYPDYSLAPIMGLNG